MVMAVPSNRSPSPVSSRPNSSHSRNPSDSISATRRSFNGNPFPRPSALTNPRCFNPVTPANSPAGFGRRNSLGGGDEKENDKGQNLKPLIAAKSPANGSKNFMSPTISAASKFTPSPRKKILVERNDPLRTSISLSDGKATFFSEISSENKEDLAVDHQNGEGKDVILDGPRSSNVSKRVTFSEVQSDSKIATEVKPEAETIGSNYKNMPSCFSVSPIIAPLDADPSIAPYDPKTNYLSPRPQFLHYKPNPRIEVLLSKEKGLDLGGAKRLDDCFMLEASDSFSENDGTEGSLSEGSQKDSDDSSVENPIPKVEEEGIHAYEVSTTCDPKDSFKEIVEGKEEAKTFSEPIGQDMCEGIAEGIDEAENINPPDSHHISDGVVHDIEQASPWFFTKLMCVSLLLVLVIAGISIWSADYPFIDSSSISNILKSSKLPEPSQLADAAKANFNVLGGKFKRLSFDSISHLSLLVNNLGLEDNVVTVKFMNLTDLHMLVSSSLENHEKGRTFLRDLGDEDLEKEEGAKTEPFEEQTHAEVFANDFNVKVLETESELEIEVFAETNEVETSETLRSLEASPDVDTEREYKIDNEDNSAPVFETPEFISELEASQHNPEVIESEHFEVDTAQDSEANVELSSADINHGSTASDALAEIVEYRNSEMVKFTTERPKNNYMTYLVVAVPSLVLALLSAAAFVYLKQSNASNTNPVINTYWLSSKKINPTSSVPQRTSQERASCQNWATEVDVEGESCPSEVSSFETSSFFSRKDLKGANEVQSQGREARKPSKRESLASSSDFSEDSPSYGSFTTYERIPSKHAVGDDEIMTPVRRSSRLRYHGNFS